MLYLIHFFCFSVLAVVPKSSILLEKLELQASIRGLSMAERFDSFSVKRKVANAERLSELRRFFPDVSTVSVANHCEITGNESHRSVVTTVAPFIAMKRGQAFGFVEKEGTKTKISLPHCSYCSAGLSFGYVDRDIVKRNDLLVPEIVYPYKFDPEDLEKAIQRDLGSFCSNPIIDTRLLDLTKMDKRSSSDFLLEMQVADQDTLPAIKSLFEDSIEKARTKSKCMQLYLKLNRIFKKIAYPHFIKLDPNQRIIKYLIDDLDVFYKDQVIALIWVSDLQKVVDYSLDCNGLLLKKAMQGQQTYLSYIEIR